MSALGLVCLEITPAFRPGEPPPPGYSDRIEWARVQRAAGLRQAQCQRCMLWLFPKEPHDCQEERDHAGNR